MRLSACARTVALAAIPAVGNTETGALVGLTPEGAALVGAFEEGGVTASAVPASCAELVACLRDLGMVEEEPGDGFARREGSPDGPAGSASASTASAPGAHDGASPAGSQGSIASTSAPLVPTMRSAYLHVTDTCNLACVGCYSAGPNRNRATDPALADEVHAIDLLARLGVRSLVLSGGEPLVRDDLPHIARAAKDAGMTEVTVLTNGTLCTPERLAALAGAVDTISVSFDGVRPTDPAPIRGVQLYDRLVAAVRAVADAGMRPHILPTLHAGNIDDVPAYIDLARSLGATVGFSLLSGAPDTLGALMPDASALAHLADVMCAADVALGDGADGSGAADAAAHQLAARLRCGAGRTGVSVAADGTVYPCHMLHLPGLALGSAFTDTAEAVARALAAFELPTVEAIDTCSSCGRRYLCGGGCRARAYLATGSLSGADPYGPYYDRALALATERLVAARDPASDPAEVPDPDPCI